jgi:hypothetical protein
MTFSVYQHWDPLKVCVVGRSYPPEFYSWITVPHVRALFEQIATETEEDYQNIIKTLEKFGVEVLRPELPHKTFVNGKHLSPPMTPRDYTAMIGETFYENSGYHTVDYQQCYNDIKDPSWPSINTVDDYKQLPLRIQQECKQVHGINFDNLYQKITNGYNNCYDKIYDRIRAQGNTVISGLNQDINGAMVYQIGKDLYFGTHEYTQDTVEYKNVIDKEFPNTRNHIVNTGGHADGTYFPVCPGLIISLHDVPTYAETFPDWEVVYLPGQSWVKIDSFSQLKEKNRGKWWIPGFEHDQQVIDLVENWLGHWTGYVEETVFDVNLLIIDPKNVMVFNYNKQVFDALNRHGITPHIVPFRHKSFWDGGIHCVTSDLHREGTRQDYFSERKDV